MTRLPYLDDDNEEGKPTRWNYHLPELALLTDCSTARIKTTKLKLNANIPLQCMKNIVMSRIPKTIMSR
jgi:hypothetical protein